MLSRIIFGLIAMSVAIVFFAVPVIKLFPTLGLRTIPLGVVVLIGVVMMIYEFIETVRESSDDSGH